MKKILIIEDDKVLRGELKILLGANGYEPAGDPGEVGCSGHYADEQELGCG